MSSLSSYNEDSRQDKGESTWDKIKKFFLGPYAPGHKPVTADPRSDIKLLLITDRCDQCGNRAYVRVELNSSRKTLDFCVHHYRKYQHTLAKLSHVTYDNISLLRKEVR